MQKLGEKLQKIFPPCSKMTEKQLKKEAKGYALMQFFFLGLTVFWVIFFAFAFSPIAAKDDVLLEGFWAASFLGGFGACFSMYLHHRISEVEVRNELRLREILEQLQTPK